MPDNGEKYDDKGMLGSYRTSEVQFPNPEGLKVFSGFGADEADLELGFIRPEARQLPNYDQSNYYNRWTQPKVPDEDEGNRDSMSQDFEFRTKNLNSRGFLTRPRTPTERG